LSASVINLKGKLKKKESFRLPDGVVYVGGAMPWLGLKKSIWANPYNKMFRKCDITREECIAMYREYVLSHNNLMARLPELQGKVLGCWCAPEPCHGDVLLRLIDHHVAC
jgi:hypothetical protein